MCKLGCVLPLTGDGGEFAERFRIDGWIDVLVGAEMGEDEGNELGREGFCHCRELHSMLLFDRMNFD